MRKRTTALQQTWATQLSLSLSLSLSLLSSLQTHNHARIQSQTQVHRHRRTSDLIIAEAIDACDDAWEVNTSPVPRDLCADRSNRYAHVNTHTRARTHARTYCKRTHNARQTDTKMFETRVRWRSHNQVRCTQHPASALCLSVSVSASASASASVCLSRSLSLPPSHSHTHICTRAMQCSTHRQSFAVMWSQRG